MATYNQNNQPIITCGSPATTHLCADLKQIKNGATWDIKLRSNNEVIDTVATLHPDIEEEII